MGIQKKNNPKISLISLINELLFIREESSFVKAMEILKNKLRETLAFLAMLNSERNLK